MNDRSRSICLGLALSICLLLAAHPCGASGLYKPAAPPPAPGDTLVFTLDSAIEQARGGSPTMRGLLQRLQSAELNLISARARYRTSASARFTTPAYDEGYTEIEQVGESPVYSKFRRLRTRGLLDLRQPLPWIPLGGGTMTLRSEAYQLNSWTPISADPEAFLKTSRFYTSLSMILEKPLFTPNDVRLGLQRAELAHARQARIFERSELDLVFEVTSAFYLLHRQAEELRITADRVARQEEIFATTSNKYRAGLIAEVDALQAEVALAQARSQLQQAGGELAARQDAFKQLIGLPLGRPVAVEAAIEPRPVVIHPDSAVARALRLRGEIIERRIGVAEQTISVEQTRAEGSIRGNLRAYYDLAGFSDPALPWSTPTDELLRSSWEELRRTPNRGVTFEIEVPLWDWGGHRAQVHAARAELREQELSLADLQTTVTREVHGAVRRVEQAWERLQILARGREVSRRSFTISLARFANGQITSTELARASDQLDDSEISYLSAAIDYRLGLADLARKTLFDVETGAPLVGISSGNR